MGDRAVDAGELEEARSWFLRHRRASRDPSAATARVASRWLAAGRPDAALEAVHAASADGVGGPRLLLAEGLSLTRLHRFAAGAAALRKVLPGDEPYLPARAALALVLARAGGTQAAVRSLAEPLRRNPGDRQLLLARAAVLERAGRGREAERELAAAAARSERSGAWDDAVAFVIGEAQLRCRAGRPGDAVAILARAGEGHPRAPGLLLAQAAAHQSAGQGEAAAADLRTLLAIAPEHPGALAQLAGLLAGRDDHLEEAESLARRAVRLAPTSAAAHGALGAVLARRDDGAGAVEALERASRLGEPDPEVLDRLGDAYRAVGRAADAAGAWRQALRAAADAPPSLDMRLAAALRRKLRAVKVR
jgi:tetratricopeptide (TPR) repeat protein